jgi:outer membrane protein assembly factor BamB
MKSSLLALIAWGAFAVAGLRADWPNYRGPSGDGIAGEILTATEWPAKGPKALWKASTETGFSSFTVDGGKAVTLVRRDVDGNPMEVCVAFDAASGKELWARELWISNQYDGGGNAGTEQNKGGDGPRSTPVIDGNRVYVIDALLKVFAINLEDGSIAWKRDIVKEHKGSIIKWQNAASPLIHGDHLFLAGGGPGEALLALNKADGKTAWKAEDDAMTHATPIFSELHGTPQVIFFTQKGLVAVAPDSGSVLWRFAFPFKVSTAASPVVWEDIVYCSAGYGVGAGAARIDKAGDKFTATQIWRSENDNMNHWSTPVVKGGFLYGMFSFKEYGTGPLACIDIRSGEKQWSQPGFGPGNVILTGDRILALTDAGELVLVKAQSVAYAELARAKVISGKCWSTPALVGGKAFVRSTTEGGCFDLGAVKVAAR